MTERDGGRRKGGDMIRWGGREFSVWKRNTPFLYDLMISHPLEWPSLTLHWVPLKPIPYSIDLYLAVHKLILGTHTDAGAPDFLMVVDKCWTRIRFCCCWFGWIKRFFLKKLQFYRENLGWDFVESFNLNKCCKFSVFY